MLSSHSAHERADAARDAGAHERALIAADNEAHDAADAR